MKSSLIVLTVSFLFNGCAAFTPLEPGEQPVTKLAINQAYPGPDAGAGLPLQTLHFLIEGYGGMPSDKSKVLERIYTEVMNQTALYSFKPKDNYRVVIYKTQLEFMQKTGQPEWAGGMKTGTSVFTYEQGFVDVVLAHEITHIIFGEFMGKEGQYHRWLNEGLAMFIESHFDPVRQFDSIETEWRGKIRGDVMELDRIVAFQPYSEESKYVETWYATVASLTAFLIERGGTLNFSLFLKELKNGTAMTRAFQMAYPGKFKSLEELYQIWKASL